MIYKCLVKTIEDLPSTNNTIGDKRLVLFDKKVYEWNGSSWELHVDVTVPVEKVFKIRIPT